MAELNETPRGNRIHIAFFGLRNAGKSTLVNAFTGQNIAIVSDVPGTTTDPVSKAMEILPLGPCLITDTAGLDDVGELGEMRVRKTLKVLETVDIAVWVWGKMDGSISDKRSGDRFPAFAAECRKRGTVVIEYNRGDSVEELKKRIAAVKLEEKVPGLLDGLVEKGDRVLCVVPIDESAPKGRLILPQQQIIRECLDKGLVVTVCQPNEVQGLRLKVQGSGFVLPFDLVITDSQAFGTVKGLLPAPATRGASGTVVRLTSFSILFARQKGDLKEYVKGLEAIGSLKDGDTVLVAEGCTHHRQCNDIGTVKIPKALETLSGKKLKFEFASGGEFPDFCASLTSGRETASPLFHPSLVVHCGGCMLTRREMQRRIAQAREAGVPIVNYGLVLAKASGIDIENLIFAELTANN